MKGTWQHWCNTIPLSGPPHTHTHTASPSLPFPHSSSPPVIFPTCASHSSCPPITFKLLLPSPPSFVSSPSPPPSPLPQTPSSPGGGRNCNGVPHLSNLSTCSCSGPQVFCGVQRVLVLDHRCSARFIMFLWTTSVLLYSACSCRRPQVFCSVHRVLVVDRKYSGVHCSSGRPQEFCCSYYVASVHQ